MSISPTSTINLSGGEYSSLVAATAAGAATINYGSFLNAIINFLIVAFAVFVLVKQTQRFRHQEESKHVEPPKSELLLAEIRDLLKERQ